MGDDLSITKTPAITPSITSPGTSGDGSAQIISFHPASQLPIKLTGSGNFPTWKAQVYTLMCGYDLLDFLEGSNPVPAVSSSAYRLWFRQDNLIRNALIASADPTIAPTIASSKTSKQAWDYLHTTYANKSQTRIYTLRDILAKLSKDEKSVTDYLREIRTVSDELATAGAPVDTAELVVKILSGLGSDYKEISAAIRARDNPISFEELQDKLVDHELFLKHEDAKKPPAPITVQVAQSSAAGSSNGSQNGTRSNRRW